MHALVLAVPFFFSPIAGACSVLIHSNDVLANVMEDGQIIGVVPKRISCSDKLKTLKVFSRSGQVFSRVLPAKKDFDLGLHGHWNVMFAEPNSTASTTTKVVVGKDGESIAFSNLKATQQSLIKELEAVKGKVSQLSRKLNSSEAPIRKLSSTSAKEKGRLKGVYLQLHAFKGEKWDFNSITDEIKKVNSDPGQYRVQFCLRNESLGEKWTRVFWGPFASKDKARVTARDLTGNAFVVSDPNCQLE